jgi:hypothetical protein
MHSKNPNSEPVLEVINPKLRRMYLVGAILLIPIAMIFFGKWGALSASPAAAAVNVEQVCLPATGDAYVDSANPTGNYGSEGNLLLEHLSQNTSLVYLQFDVNKIPSNATVITSTLEMYLEWIETSDNQYQSTLHASDGAWSEGTLNWGNHPRFSGSYDMPVHDVSFPAIKKWDATNLVADWLSGKRTNYGMVIEPDPNVIYQASYASRENLLQEPIPQLCVGYELPGPAPTPTRTPLPTWTPIPSESPAPGPTPTATPPVFVAAYHPISNLNIGTLFQPDLSIHGFEITEGIQCFDTSKGLSGCADNSLPVVTKKDSTARIYLKYSGLFSGANNVPVRLYLIANGVTYTANAVGNATKTIDQSKNDDARVYFNVNFSNDIPVSFYAVVDPNNTISETNETNNRYPASGYITLNFRRRGNLKIVGDRLRYHPSGYTGSQYAGGWAVNGGAADWYEQVLPIRNNGIQYSLKSGYLNWTTTLNSDGQHALIQYLNFRWILENALSWLFGSGAFTNADHVYGWAPNDGYSGGHADMPVYPHAGGYGVVGIGTDNPGTSTDNPGSGALIFGHELTHDYNIYHTDTGADDCGSNDSNSDFPYGTSSIQEFGFNPITGKIYDPASTHDLMSYCPSGGSKLGWISPFTWNKMFNNLSPSLTSAVGTQAQSGVFQTTANSESLVVNLTIYNTDFTPEVPGELGDLYRLGTGITYPPAPGDYSVELRQDSTILATQTFSVSFEAEYSAVTAPIDFVPSDTPPFPPGPYDRADLSFVMPWADGTNQIFLMHGGEVLDQRAVSANPPEVAITDPVEQVEWPAGSKQTLSWTGSDPDGDSLTYSVLYSYDGGVNWAVLVAGLSQTSLEVEVDALAGTNDARFRVVASDGVNTAHVETPLPISIPNKAPVAVISDPEDGAVFAPGDLVVLVGNATDLEDGGLPDEVLHWSSDRQGSLGIGPSLPLTVLEPGWHQISLSVVDSLGIAGSDSRMVFIGHEIHLPLITQ